MRLVDVAVKKWLSLFAFMLALVFVWVLHGAVPFRATPTLLQAVWAMGFSQSFINESIFSIHALNIGAPRPAAIAFGLAGVYPAGLFIAAGMHAADAYASVFLLWLTLAFWSAWRIALWLGASRPMAVLAAVLWLSMPVIWAHAGYSMLSLGIALLSFYFWAALKLFGRKIHSGAEKTQAAALYFSACLAAVFMDGYSFMMFAVGSSMVAVFSFSRFSEMRSQLLGFSFPVHASGFALAYFLYAVYVGKTQFDPAPIEFFRGWGADLTFFAAPTLGFHWMWDALGLSVPRPRENFFGDESVWRTTFSLPLMVAGLIAWWRTRKQNALATAFLLVAAFGFYMALGPSLKINSTRPPEMIAAGQLDPAMPAALAVAPTGSAWLFGTLPGFKSMRAVYRWSALGVFALWVLIVLMLAREQDRTRSLAMLLVVFLVVSNLPHLDRNWKSATANRTMFLNIDRDFVDDMGKVISPGEQIAFLPYRNDFMVNYLASRLGIRTYNIGGDKNLFGAQKHWPAIMQQFQLGKIDADFADRVLLLLLRKEADAVVLPYIDMMWGALAWPAAPIYKKELAPVIEAFRASKHVSIEERQLYAIVRLAPPFRQQANSRLLEEEIITDRISYPLTPPQSVWALPEGWHASGAGQVWSRERSVVNLPVPDNCSSQQCFGVIKFGVFAASEQSPVTIRFALEGEGGGKWAETFNARTPEGHSLAIPLVGRKGVQRLSIEVPNASSPYKLGMSPDPRILGIALRSVDIGAISYPVQVGPKAGAALALVLKDGWHSPEASHVWSMERARLNLPVPDKCGEASCLAVIEFGVFAASEQRPVTVRFTLSGGGKPWSETITAVRPEQAIAVPMGGQQGSTELLIEVPGATSPHRLGLSADARILGIALRSVDMRP